MHSIYLSWMYVGGGVLFSALAQILLKRATPFAYGQIEWVLYILASLSCYGISFAAYYLALQRYPISQVGPTMSIGVILIIVIYGISTGEIIDVKQALGILLGAAAIFLILS